jgi:hypothetical protein
VDWTLLAAAALVLQGLCLIGICSMTVWCTCRQKDGKGKVKLSKQEQDAAKRREQIAAAAEARIARLKLVSEQQQLWCSCLISTLWEIALHNLASCCVDTCSRLKHASLRLMLMLQVTPQKRGHHRQAGIALSRNQIIAGCITAAAMWIHARRQSC